MPRITLYDPPKCAYSDCFNVVEQAGYHWKKYCSSECGKLGGRERKKSTFKKNFSAEAALADLVRRRQETCIKNFGVDNPQKSPEIREQTIQTNIAKYGVEHAVAAPEVIRKQKETLFKNYGVTSPLKSPELLEKTKNTNLARYGTEWACMNEEIRAKQKATLTENYGVNTPFASKVIRDRAATTLFDHHGVDNPTKNVDILEKSLLSGKRVRNYMLPSGTVIKLRGYEPFALDMLLKTFSEEQILHSLKLMPTIFYQDEERRRRYYPDFFIPSENLIIEVKSEYTFNANKKINLLKRDATIELGFDYKFMIFGKDGSLI